MILCHKRERESWPAKRLVPIQSINNFKSFELKRINFESTQIKTNAFKWIGLTLNRNFDRCTGGQSFGLESLR